MEELRGGGGVRGGERGAGRGEGGGKGRILFEGRTHGVALEGLRGAVVVHHAASRLSFRREEQATEFAHLSKGEGRVQVRLQDTCCRCHSLVSAVRLPGHSNTHKNKIKQRN